MRIQKSQPPVAKKMLDGYGYSKHGALTYSIVLTLSYASYMSLTPSLDNNAKMSLISSPS